MNKIIEWLFGKSDLKSEVRKAKAYLKESGNSATPVRLKELLRLKQTSETLARKFREAANNGELLKTYYYTDTMRRVVEYRYNPEYQETI